MNPGEPIDLRKRPPDAWFKQAWTTVQLGHRLRRALFWRGFAAGVATALAGVAAVWWLS